MSGLAVVCGSIVGGTLVSLLDPVAGVALIVVGAICGCVITWMELS